MGISRAQVLSAGSKVAFVYVVSIIVAMGSERIYWYWDGFTAGSVLEISLYYMIPVSVALWSLARLPSFRLSQVILAGAIYAFIVEGVLTPVIYADGPLPFLAAMFVGWHGMVAFVGLFYLTRHWLLSGRTRLLAIVSSVFGSLWGVWAYASAFGDAVEISEKTGSLLGPLEFALYATGVALVLVVGHWLVGFVWPDAWTPSRVGTWVVALLAAAYFAIAVLLAVPWAPVKLGVLLGGTLWMMRKASTADAGTSPTVLDHLVGRVPLRSAAPILLMAVTASTTYAVMWLVGPGTVALGALYWLLVAAQVAGGALAYGWAARESFRSSAIDRPDHPVSTPE